MPVARLVGVTALLALLLMGCSSAPKGRIKGADEEDLVGKNRAGGATFRMLIAESTEKLLDGHARDLRPGEPFYVAFVGVENKTVEELRDSREAIYESIDTVLVNNAAYTPVSRRMVDHTLKLHDIVPEDLFLAAGRDLFRAELTKQGITPDFLLWCKLSTMSTFGENVSQRDYQMTLDLVDANSGLTVRKETALVSKEYLD